MNINFLLLFFFREDITKSKKEESQDWIVGYLFNKIFYNIKI